MAKLTKRQYTKAKDELLANLANRIAEVESAISALCGGPCSIEQGDAINAMHDAVANAEQAIRELDSEWETRNWTAQDWAEHELIINNVD